MNSKTRTRTVAALEKAVVDFTRPEKIRRACALRLARMTAATRPATTPAPDQESLLRGKLLARDTFLTLHAQRRALIKNTNRTPADNAILDTLLAEMPDTMPAGTADNAAWCNFVGAVHRTLAAVKSLPTK